MEADLSEGSLILKTKLRHGLIFAKTLFSIYSLILNISFS